MNQLQRMFTLAAIVGVSVAPLACSSSGSTAKTAIGDAASETTRASSAPSTKPIVIVVTDDDGIAAPGIDELARQLKALPGVTVHVVAPAANQSGKGDATTPGTLKYHDATTASGIKGIAVEGTPADSVNVAINVLKLKPDLVASGINWGQNVGPLASVSGTVGATITAARLGVPGIAGSAGINAHPSYALAAQQVINWITTNRTRIAGHQMPTDHVVNINVPECSAGTPHPLVSVPTSAAIPNGANVFETDCSATKASYKPTSDVDAMLHGFIAMSDVPAK